MRRQGVKIHPKRKRKTYSIRRKVDRTPLHSSSFPSCHPSPSVFSWACALRLLVFVVPMCNELENCGFTCQFHSAPEPPPIENADIARVEVWVEDIEEMMACLEEMVYIWAVREVVCDGEDQFTRDMRDNHNRCMADGGIRVRETWRWKEEIPLSLLFTLSYKIDGC